MLVLFGSTSDLARSRLLPAFKELGVSNIIALGRSFKNTEEYNASMGTHVHGLRFIQHAIGSSSHDIVSAINDKRKTNVLSILVEVFNGDEHLMKKLTDNVREIIEGTDFKSVNVYVDKPIGSSKETCTRIIDMFRQLHANVVYIDHYLYKPAIKHYDHPKDVPQDVLFVATEHLTITGRESFWNTSGGIVSDMIQSHILNAIYRFLDVDPELCNFSKFKCQNVQYAPGSAFPVFVDVSFVCRFQNKDITIRIVSGKHQEAKETYAVLDGKKIDLLIPSCAAYRDMIEEIVNNKPLVSVNESVILRSWDVAKQINDSIAPYPHILKM